MKIVAITDDREIPTNTLTGQLIIWQQRSLQGEGVWQRKNLHWHY
jgi:hypothetical protein